MIRFPLENGYHLLPPGRMANIVSYYEKEVTQSDATRPRPAQGGIRLESLHKADIDRYLALYRTIGRDYLWTGHLVLERELLAERLGDGTYDAVALASPQGDIGIVTIDLRKPSEELRNSAEAEIVYFGLIKRATGQGLGKWLMNAVMGRIAARDIKRVWLHTCNYDHPGAARFYKSCGFELYATGIQIADDPRQNGIWPEDVAPQVPLVLR